MSRCNSLGMGSVPGDLSRSVSAPNPTQTEQTAESASLIDRKCALLC